MKNQLLFIVFLFIYLQGTSQESKTSNPETLLKELAENGCKCVDSINAYNKTKTVVAREISECIKAQASAFQTGSKLMMIDTSKTEMIDGKKQINISIATDENSKEYQSYYFEMERYMMNNCPSLQAKMAGEEKQGAKSFSENKKALEFYSKGLREAEKENFEKAVDYFAKAVKEDREFAFAWDNLGVNYRRLNNFDKAIECYTKSLEIDPNGLMPLQNIAIAYQYKKEYDKAIEAYQKLALVDKKNPEVYYGIGNVYATNLKEYEKGLDCMCKAYNLYIEQKSPYRTDAEKLINQIYAAMKKQGKEEEFSRILKDNNITQK